MTLLTAVSGVMVINRGCRREDQVSLDCLDQKLSPLARDEVNLPLPELGKKTILAPKSPGIWRDRIPLPQR